MTRREQLEPVALIEFLGVGKCGRALLQITTISGGKFVELMSPGDSFQLVANVLDDTPTDPTAELLREMDRLVERSKRRRTR